MKKEKSDVRKILGKWNISNISEEIWHMFIYSYVKGIPVRLAYYLSGQEPSSGRDFKYCTTKRVAKTGVTLAAIDDDPHISLRYESIRSIRMNFQESDIAQNKGQLISLELCIAQVPQIEYSHPEGW